MLAKAASSHPVEWHATGRNAARGKVAGRQRSSTGGDDRSETRPDECRWYAAGQRPNTLTNAIMLLC